MRCEGHACSTLNRFISQVIGVKRSWATREQIEVFWFPHTTGQACVQARGRVEWRWSAALFSTEASAPRRAGRGLIVAILRGAGWTEVIFLNAAAIAGLSGCARRAKVAVARPNPLPGLVPVRAETDRIFRLTVCLRPFRAAGPWLEVERVGDKTVVHNYGHGE